MALNPSLLKLSSSAASNSGICSAAVEPPGRTGSCRTWRRRAQRLRKRQAAAPGPETPGSSRAATEVRGQRSGSLRTQSRDQEAQVLQQEEGEEEPGSTASCSRPNEKPQRQQYPQDLGGSSSVVLGYRTNRLLRVMAVRAAFDHLSSGQSSLTNANASTNTLLIRAMMQETFRFLDAPLVWQVEMAEDRWADCDPLTATRLNELLASGETSVRIRARAWSYELDLTEMTQTNLSTNRTRRLRILDPYEPLSVPSSEWAVAEGGSVSGTSTIIGPRWQFQTGHGWADCDGVVRKLLEQAEAAGQTSVEFESRGFSYVLDLQRLTQTNTSTGRVRNLRRLAPPSAEGGSTGATSGPN